MKTSDDYAPCMYVYPSGMARRTNILATGICDIDEAERRLRNDYATAIAPSDWPALCERMTVTPPTRWRPVVTA